MANQTELLNVSNEMKLNDKRQIIEGQERGEELCSSSAPATCRVRDTTPKEWRKEKVGIEFAVN